MKRANNKRILLIAMAFGVLSMGCRKNFLNDNSNPNQVTDNNITAELIFPQAENAVGVRQSSSDFGFIFRWIGYLAQNGSFAPQQNELTYNIDFTFGNALFVDQYGVLFDLHQAENKALVSGDTALAGASIVLEAKLFQELVDLYGDIPYSQAFQSSKYPHPVYDKAQDIYAALELRLDTAISYLEGTPAKAFDAVDIIAHGNTTLWISFANTLKLRLLIRQSEVSGFNPSAEITKILNKGGVLGAGQSISVNPGYTNDVNKQNPFYSGNGWTPSGAEANTADNPNNYIINIMLSNNDPRIARFWYPVGFSGNTYLGAVFGENLADVPQGPALSYFGPALVGSINSSNVGDGSGAAQNQWIYPSFESMFLYAEAVARGWMPDNTNDTAAYAAAVTESFTWLGVPNAHSAAAAYMANNASANYANAGSTPLSKARFTAYQKYIALTCIDPLEAYSDLRRLNMLTDNSYISVAPGKLSPTLPVRLLYPQSEYTSNSANVSKEGTINQFTSKLFWEP
jgi:SusD/RagB-like outer membrane lipoprotein